jgi:polysaccharide chain length determinant protein (PEP-CTERM system associated)
MQELINQVLSAARGMWKHRWLGVAAAWIAGLVGAVVVFNIPNRYEASARIQVDTESILKPLLAGLAVQPNVEQQVTMLSRTLISRPNVEKVVQMADLDLRSASKAQHDALVDGLMTELRITGTGANNLYVLAFRHTDPERAKRAVQSLVSIFVESGLGASKKDSESARAFIAEQIKNYQGKLEEAEARLKDFKLRNLDAQVGDGKDITVRLSELSGQLEKARLELREAENAKEAARTALENEKTQTSTLSTQSLAPEAGLVVATPEIDARLDAQRRNLDALLQRFTELHPEVVATRRLIKDIEQQREVEMQALKRAASARQAASPAGAAGVTPATQELNRMLAMSEVQVAALKARVSEFQNRYAQARAQLKSAPQLEAEAAQLNRDYAIHKKNYEDLVARRETAAISGEVEVSAGMADFRVIDPPRVAPQPVWPNRKMLLGVVLLAALGVGGFAAFAAWQIRPVFFDIGELRSKLGVPVLGAISTVMDDASRRQQRVDRIGFVAASVGLVALFGVGLALVAFQQARMT